MTIWNRDPIGPAWTTCPECGHHEMAHKSEGDRYRCVVWECNCNVAKSSEPGDRG